jgi:hypothetical protein
VKTRNLGIELDEGTDFNLTLRIGGIDGPIDITGYEFLGMMSPTTDQVQTPGVAQFEFTVLDQATKKGQVLMSLSRDQDSETEITSSTANALFPRRQRTPFLFDVKMLDTTGIVTRILKGVIYFSPEATQEAFT